MPQDQHDQHNSFYLMTTRVIALEIIPTARCLVDPLTLDGIVDLYERQIGPRNVARVVAWAWPDPAHGTPSRLENARPRR